MQSTLLGAVVRRVFPCVLVALTTLAARPAMGADANVEKQARALQKRAVEEDSLNVNYPEAVKKLAAAIGKCDGDKCSVSLKGALYRDLGAMLILGGSSVDDGRAAFAKALGLDPSLDLDPAYKNPMLEGMWNDAKRKASGGGAGGGGAGAGAGTAPAGGGDNSGAGGGDTGGGGAGGGGGAQTGDFAHVPAPAQLVRTPLPVYAEYSGSEKLLRVVVKYRGPGMTDWKPVELRHLDTGYGGLIPCKDVTLGNVQYYIQGYGTSDDPVASSGSRSKPFSVPVKAELSGQGPSLPGQEPPRQCAESTGGTDCPPDFPGCKAKKKAEGEDCHRNGECESGQCAGGLCVDKKGEGEDCEADGECASGSCSDSKCTAPKKGSDETCDSDDDCSSGTCKDGKCGGGGGSKKSSGGGGKYHKIWIGLGVSLDLVSLPQATNVCKLNASGTAPANSAGYQCVDPSTGANFPGGNATANGQFDNGMVAATDSLSGGFVPGNLRILASFDYALGMNVLVGARAGYVLLTDPASSPGPAFAPIHIEGRFTYLFGQNALTNGFSPFVFLAAGVGEFDANLGVTATLTQASTTTPPSGPLLAPGPRPENAWLTAGPFFGALGIGGRVMLGSNLAATLAIKGEGAFGGSAGSLFGVAPELGMQLGL